jgi:hypothetical protein
VTLSLSRGTLSVGLIKLDPESWDRQCFWLSLSGCAVQISAKGPAILIEAFMVLLSPAREFPGLEPEISLEPLPARFGPICLFPQSFSYSLYIHSFIYSPLAVQPLVGPWHFLQFRYLLHTVGRTPWAGDQPVGRPLPTHRTTETQNKRTHKHSCLEWDSNPQF